AEELGAQLICYGHTHVADARQLNNQLFINPGSIRLPRSRPEKTYCILRWEDINRSEEHTSELQSRFDLVCRLLLEKKKKRIRPISNEVKKPATRQTTRQA